MTKAELIRKMVKRSGIPDSEAKVFFEIFLQKASVMLRPGQAIKLKDFGYFQLRMAVFKTTSSKSSGKINQINTEVIVFSAFDESGEEGLIFNIPAVVTGKYNYIDSYFSLSTGKPIIPLQGVKDADYFTMPTGYEMKKLIESKVEKLLEEVEIIKDYIKDNEILFLKKTSFKDEQEDSNWKIGKLDNGTLNLPSGDENSAAPGGDTNYNNVTWDFGEDLSRQIEEEAIIDESSELEPASLNNEPQGKRSLDWDFGEQFIAKVTEKIEKDEFDDSSEFPSNDDDTDAFQRVKAITAEFNFDDKKSSDLKKEDNLLWDFGEDEANVNNEVGPIDNRKFENPDETEPENTIDTISVTDQEVPTKESLENEPEDITPLALDSNKGAPSKSTIDKTRTREYDYSQKRSFLPFLIAMVTIVAVGATVYMYINKISLYNFTTGKFLKSSNRVAANITPAVIERNFDVPVTYPYPKNPKQSASVDDFDLSNAINNKNIAAVKPAAIKNNTAVVSNVPKKPETKVKSVKTQPPAKVNKTPVTKEASKKISNIIYQQGQNFIVQVSAWRSKSIADNEAAKFKAKGYITYLEKAEIPGRGTWYRIKVGNFKSVAEAEKFSAKNK